MNKYRSYNPPAFIKKKCAGNLISSESRFFRDTKKYYIVKLFLLISLSLGIFIQNAVSQPNLTNKIINIGPPINTRFDEFAPSITADGKTMVFNSKRHGKYLDIYICYLRNKKWTEPKPVHSINSRYNDESPYITPDGSFIFFASDRDGSLEMPKDQYGQIRVSFDLYVTKKIGGVWDRPIPIPGTVNSTSHERSPSLSLDSKTLFYSSWPFGNITKARIMKAEYRNGSFINPTILPAPLNLGGKEAGLVPALDGKGYYFSSMRSEGFGGWDIYYVSFKSGKFGNPVNLGPGINSSANEIYLSLVGKTMYFCSNRPGGHGLYDIYTSGIPDDPEKESELKIIVKDKKTKKPLSVDLQVSTRIKESENKTTTYEINKRTDKQGKASIKYKPQVKELDIIIDEEGYLPLFKSIDLSKNKGKPQKLELVPFEEKASFEIHAIHFDFESARIKRKSYPYLDALAEYLEDNPSLKFEIIGHTDLHGTHKFNNKLSLKRAKAVKNYLVSKGLASKRFKIKGAGKTQPKIRKKGPGYDSKNRRTEFRLMEK